MKHVIKEIAHRIINCNPDPVVHYLILRYILRVPVHEAELIQAKSNLKANKWVQQLQNDQWEDGSWGRFHSRDSKLKQKTPTTEIGIRHACQLGLDLNDKMLQKGRDYCVRILTEQEEIRDRKEFQRHTGFFNTGIRKIVAATLSEIEPDHPILDKYREFWLPILVRSFSDGKYNRKSEIQAHTEIRKISSVSSLLRETKNKVFQMTDRYSVKLLGTRPDLIPEDVERAWFHKLWEEGVYYISGTDTGDLISSQRYQSWFDLNELLCLLPSWKRYMKSHMKWLSEQRNENGFWDFGKKIGMPLSSNYRKNRYREFDWTTKVFLILQTYYAE